MSFLICDGYLMNNHIKTHYLKTSVAMLILSVSVILTKINLSQITTEIIKAKYGVPITEKALTKFLVLQSYRMFSKGYVRRAAFLQKLLLRGH